MTIAHIKHQAMTLMTKAPSSLLLTGSFTATVCEKSNSSVSCRYHTPAPSAGLIPTPDATLINGLGRSVNGDATPLAVINVVQGKRYRFRLVSISCDPNYIFSIDGHNMTIIEVDGVNHQPLTVDSIQIFAGQRYSVIVTAVQPVDNYWVRAQPSSGFVDFDGGLNSAILHYQGAAIAEPKSSSNLSNPMLQTNLHPLKQPGAPGGNRTADVSYVLDIQFQFATAQFTINNASFTTPTLPVLLQILSGAYSATDLLPQGSVYVLPKNKIIELTIPGGAVGSPVSPVIESQRYPIDMVTWSKHPFHLHGVVNITLSLRATASSMGKLSLISFIRDQLARVPPPENADLTGKTVVVIGANSGIGFEVSKHFARMKPTRLILACRSQAKGEGALQKIKEEIGYEAELWILDLSEFSSVIAFADRFDKECGRLDYLIENAAMATNTYAVTNDGNEHSTRPRLVIVTSEVHFWSEFSKNPEDIFDGHKKIYNVLSSKEYCDKHFSSRYHDSKRLSYDLSSNFKQNLLMTCPSTVLDIFFHRALDERLGPASPVVVNGVNPGFCYSELRREYSGLTLVFMFFMERALARTAEEGSRQLLYAALGGLGKEDDKFRGAYVSAIRIEEPSDFVLTSHEIQERLWTEVVETLGEIDSKVKDIVKGYLVSP
ncbi:hypothetical protein C0992_007119 [Termitomyces sp. T32_za158]|nr:hypothetical protein C0992_007119 [Termitomyces sp. T32_za158]